MRSMMRAVRNTLPALGMVAIVMSCTAANAGSRDHDRVYADNFGNLVVDSAAGYKRILVGEGGQAKRLSEFTGAGQPDIDVVYADRGNEVHVSEGCYRPPYLIKGRSYMYGFDQGEIPFQGGPCR